MKKRFNLTWRLVVVAALLCALVPAALIGVTAQAASTPTTYIDQLPAYLNNAGLGTVVSGTSYTGAIDLQKVRLRIKTYDSAWTPAIWRYWDGAGWTNDEETYIYATLIAASLWNGQWDWEWTDLNLITGTISDGSKIYISAWAVDNNDNIGTEVSTSFTYDQYGLLSGTTYPSVVVNPAFNSPSWTTPTTIQGTATDRISATAYGTIAAVFLNITRSNGDHWNGAAWAGADTALKATLGTPTSTSTPWSISTSTVPAIPVWTQAETYTVCVWAVDLAGNEGIPVCETFTYCKDLASGLSLVVDTVPAYIQPTFFGNLTGTARAKALKTLDAPNGSVKVWLQDYTSALSWNGTAWIPVYDTWFAAFTNISCRINNSEQRDWTVAMPNGVNLQAGHTYKYQVKAVDNGSATPVLSSVYQFIVDNAQPANTVFSTFWTTASPYGDTVFNSLTSLSGTSADTTGGTAAGSLAKVDICIQRASDSWYWNGGQWQLAQVWLPASGTNPWTFATLPAFQHTNARIGVTSGVYTITARAVDKAGWVEGTATRTFTFVKDLSGTAPSETTAPVSPAIYRTPSTMDFWVAINGSAPANKSLSISNSGGGTLDWTVSSDQTWLTVSPSTGTNAGTVNVTATLGALTVATHTGNLTITAAGATNSPQTVAVTFVVAAEGSTEPTPTPTATVAPTATATVAPTATATVAPTATATVAPTTAPSSTGSGTVGTGAGTVETTDGKIEVSFPAGSFTSDQTVTITGGTCTHANTDDYKVGSTCFSVTPGGTFDNPVTICVELSTYDKSIVDDEGKLTLAYWDGSEWVEADDVNITGNTICGTTKHLSDWAVIGKTGEGWVWWYWVLIGGGAFIVVLAIVLLLVLPKKGGKEEEVPAEELYGEEEEEF